MNFDAKDGPFAPPISDEITERIIPPRERIDAPYLRMIHGEAVRLAQVLRDHGWDKKKYEQFTSQKDFLTAIFFLVMSLMKSLGLFLRFVKN